MTCKTCGATHENADFYSSINTYCKVHWRARVKANREGKIDQYKEHDRQRANRPDRVNARKSYQQTEAGRAAKKRARISYVTRNPERRAAHVVLGNAVRDGRIEPWPACAHPEGCESSKVEAHHPDYGRPLDVVWLCPAHHKQAHALFTRMIQHAPK